MGEQTTSVDQGLSWEPYPFVITKPPFCKKMVESSETPLTLDEAGIMYDRVFGQLSELLRLSPDNRVYLPQVGVIFTHTVPASPKRELPERYRYRLSCKPFPITGPRLAVNTEEEPNNGKYVN